MKAPPRTRTRPRRPERRRAPFPRDLVATALRGPAVPLDRATRGLMEGRIGHAFGHVRVHADDRAAAAADALGADAFTHGADVAFAAGRYRPHTPEGQRLLAHELVHTLQQGGAPSPVAPQLLRGSAPGAGASADPLEREAAAAADRVATGSSVPPGLITLDAPAARNRIARQATLAPPAPVEHDDVAAAPEAVAERGDEVPSSPEVVAETAAEVEDLLVFDPDDAFGRVRRRLAQLAPLSRQAVVERAAGRAGAIGGATLARLLRELGSPAQTREPREETASREAETERDGAAPSESQAGPQPPQGVTTAELDAPRAAGGDLAGAAHDAVQPAAESPEPDVGDHRAALEEVAVEPEVIDDPAALEQAATAPGLGGAVAADPSAEGPAEPATEDALAAGPGTAAPESAAAPPPAGEAAAEPATVQVGALDELEHETVEREAEAESVEEAESDAAPGSVAAPLPLAPTVADDGALDVAADMPEPAVDPAGESAAGDPAIAAIAPQAEEVANPERPAADLAVEPEAAEAPIAEADALAEAIPATGETDVAATEPDALGAEASDEDATAEANAVGGSAAGGGGGGGAAAPIEDPPEPAAPDVSAQDPVDAMRTVGSLPPVQGELALGGVAAASSRAVGEQRGTLAASPPQLERPSGAPPPEERAAEERAAAAAGSSPSRLERTAQGESVSIAPPAPLPPAPQAVTAGARPPAVVGGPQGELSAADAAALRSTIRALPTSDPALDVSAGPAPHVRLEGDADPARSREQRRELEAASQTTQLEGRRDAGELLGEQDLYPHVQPETLRATLPDSSPAGAAATGAGGQTAGGASPAAGAGDDAAVSIVAREERGDELRSAATQASGEMLARRQEHTERAAEERERSSEEVAELVRENASQQTAARRQARADVREQRGEWRAGQDELTEQATQDADAELQGGTGEVVDQQTQAEGEAERHVEQGDREATDARVEAERTARRERERGEQESGGVLGWLASRAAAFFDGIKRAITAAFDAARAAVRRAIERAKQLAVAVIERARQAIVAVIRRVGDALIAIGDRLLAGFPALRDRFRRAIGDLVRRAEEAVNALADALKQGVQRALDKLGAALDAALGLLERGLLAAVDAYRAAVVGAISFARSVVQALAAFGVLVRDVAANPGRWLANLGSSAADGVRNHLWAAFSTAVRQWFNSKLEEVLGLGTAVWNLLRRGGISLARIGSMAWAAIRSAIPSVLIGLIIEKLVALLVPAAAAVMAIIEGLRAAWGSVQRILQAFERFMTFLRAVRSGNAGPQFANAVAAAAIAVIDFVSNWLLLRLRRPAGAIAGRIRAIAQRLGRALGRVTRRVRTGLRRVAGRLRRGVSRRSGRRRGRGESPAERRRAAQERRRRDAQERLDRAARELRPRIAALVDRGVSRVRLGAQLLWWRTSYRLSALSVEQEGAGRVGVVARANPTISLLRAGIQAARQLIHERVRHVWPESLRHPRIRERLQQIQAQRAATFTPAVPGHDPRSRIDVPAGPSAPAALDVALGSQVGVGGQQRPRRTREEVVSGAGTSSPLIVREQQQLRPGPGPIIVSLKPHDYPSIVQSIGADPAAAQQIARSILELQRTGAISGAAIGGWTPNNVAALGRLLLHVEAGRDRGAFVTMPMLVNLMARGGLTADEALLRLHQMSPTGAMSISRAAQRELELQARGQPSRMRSPQRIADVQTFLEREREVVIRWLETRLLVEPYVFQTMERFDRFLRREIVDYLLDHTLRGTFLEVPEDRR